MNSIIYNKSSSDRFDEFQKGIIDYSNTNGVNMGIDPHILADLTTAQTNWTDIYLKCKCAAYVNYQEREERKIKRADLAEKLKKHVISLYINSRVTSLDLANMKLPVLLRKKATKVVFDLHEVPVLNLNTSYGGIIAMIIRNLAGGTSKPEGAINLQIRYFIGSNPPATPEEFPFELNSSKCRL